MKKLLLCFAFAAAVLAAGCSKYDDSDLKNRVGSLEDRVTTLEELCKQMNTNISSLQTIVSALQNNDYVTGITPIMKDGATIGYTITFTKSAPITIYHGEKGDDGGKGEDGYTPKIGVRKDTDGAYYWTLDGDWLTDNDGKKVKAEGRDGQNGQDGPQGPQGEPGANGQNGEDGKNGKDGVTPKLKIENGYWYVSYDGGGSWTMLDRATGENGRDGDAFFRDVDVTDPAYVVFILADGTELVVPRGRETLSIVFDSEYPLTVVPGRTTRMGYTIVGADMQSDIDIAVIASDNYSVSVDNTGYGKGEIVVEAPRTDLARGKVSVIVSYGNKMAMKSFELLPGYYIMYTSNTNEVIEWNTGAKVPFGENNNAVSNTYENGLGIIEVSAPLISVSAIFSSLSAIHGLTSVKFPDSLKILGDMTCWACNNLLQVYLPDGLTTIGDSVFSGCTALLNIDIPDSVTTIGENAFYGCSFTTVTIPASMQFIGSSAFGKHSYANVEPIQLNTVYCKGEYPPSVGDDIFVYDNMHNDHLEHIYVPRNAVDDYKQADGWREYADIIEGYDF